MIQHSFSLPRNIRATGIVARVISSYLFLYTGIDEIRRLRAEPEYDSHLHVVVTSEMLSGQKPFQVLEQMMVRTRGVECVVLLLC
ncbi:hypothetical protein AVEN_765-1 [Araneus ventricosus]|uniref:Uncharacterized protein n=1 Tax=Araneus ventricosus TaxID=182803 RepID=A0A4Y2LDJ3_ARAVE|nr:hypothetical protein AVEN_765-1 [Araneus ventricosus]